MNKIIPAILVCSCLVSKSGFSQSLKYVKVTAIDLQHIYLKNIKAGFEYRKLNSNSGVEIELGYTYYSKEDKLATNGYFASASYNFYVKEYLHHRFVFKLAPFYQCLYMNGYLKYEGHAPFFTDYFEYRKTKYTKERYGISLIRSFQVNVTSRILLEFNVGSGVIVYRTHVPSDVVQKTYRNGVFGGKDYIAPNIIGSIKVGYSF